MKRMKIFGLAAVFLFLMASKPLKYEVGDTVSDFNLKNFDEEF